MDPSEVADRLAIAETLALYCRAIDRCDAALLAEVFSPDARIDYGDGAKSPGETIPGLLAALGAMRLTQHTIANTVIRIIGERAKAETHCVALHIIPGPDGDEEVVVGGRYLDRMVKREGRWRIAERLYVMDWNSTRPTTMRLEGGLFEGLRRRGSRGSADPSAGWWDEA
ncbi:MAG: DUF4440 domain-containing protein [Porphyrobacter sp.]|nr:DUF4440 domain-containing protein [Porphyrobacter sp.]